MNKAIKRNKNRKFISATDRYWNRIYKTLEKRSGDDFHKLERGGKIVWEPCEEILGGLAMVAAYRKTDKYRCKPLMYQVVNWDKNHIIAD